MKKNDLPPIASRKEVETFINLFMKTTSETFCEVVRATIDKSCDMGYIYLSDQKGSYNLYEFRNEKDHTTFVVDFDIDGCLLGIEVSLLTWKIIWKSKKNIEKNQCHDSRTETNRFGCFICNGKIVEWHSNWS